MPISGLVITLSEKARERSVALAALAEDRRIEIGEATESRLPIVVDTPSSEEDRHVWEWLHNLPGVVFVDVACIHFDDEQHKDLSETTP